MKSLVFDIETTGLPRKRNAPVSESKWWPYIVQISWLIFNVETNLIEKIQDYIIKLPSNIFIPPEVTKIHGIDNKKSKEKGVDIQGVLREFTKDLIQCNFLIAHNLEFDKSIVSAEYHRNGLIDWLSRYRGEKICTMRLGLSVCNIKHVNKITGKKIIKYPKLEELHEFLFDSKPKNLHNSLMDVYVCFRCFYKLIYSKDYLESNPRFSRKFNLLSSL